MAATRSLVYDLDLGTLRLDALYGLDHLAGYQPEEAELTLEWWTGLIHPEDLPSYRIAFARLTAELTPLVLRYRILHKDGRTLHIEDHVAPVAGRDGSPVRLVGTVLDVTECTLAHHALQLANSQLEQRVQDRTRELEHTNLELEAFSYSVTHELGAPLRSMNCLSKILLEEYGGHLDKQGQRYLERVAAAATRMKRLIDDLLNLSRVTRWKLRRERVNLSSLVREIVTDLKEQEPDRQVEVSIQGRVIAHWDPLLARVALENLLGNAWKYTGKRPAPRIEFGSQVVNGETVFYIQDNGVGFDMEHYDKIFLPFERLHRLDDYEGTGIGLATVQRVVAMHGGRIWAEAEVGKGAIFYFT